MLALGAGVALLGLLDDLLDAPPRGWRGHAAAVRRGELSTGALKAVGTAALALAATAGDVLATAAIVLCAHVFNLLDLRPGRSVKAFVLLAAALARRHARARAAARDRPVRRRAARARPLRPARAGDARRHRRDPARRPRRGVAAAALDAGELAGAVAILAAIALYAEVLSLSALIDRMPPLRALDWLGQEEC